MLDASIAAPVSVPATGRSNTLGGLSQTWCDSRGVPFVDATDALEARAAKGELVYQAFDTHLSTAGHEVVAELLLETFQNPNPPTNKSVSPQE